MGRTCIICRDVKRIKQIEEAIINMVPYRKIASQFGIATSTISRHLHDCSHRKLLERRRAKHNFDIVQDKGKTCVELIKEHIELYHSE